MPKIGDMAGSLGISGFANQYQCIGVELDHAGGIAVELHQAEWRGGPKMLVGREYFVPLIDSDAVIGPGERVPAAIAGLLLKRQPSLGSARQQSYTCTVDDRRA